MPKFIKVSRTDTQGSYVQLPNQIPGIVEAELDDIDYLNPGVEIILTIVEMSQEDFDALPEFMGW